MCLRGRRSARTLLAGTSHITAPTAINPVEAIRRQLNSPVFVRDVDGLRGDSGYLTCSGHCMSSCLILVDWVEMGKGGLEPPRLAAHDPKSCSSANSDTPPRWWSPDGNPRLLTAESSLSGKEQLWFAVTKGILRMMRYGSASRRRQFYQKWQRTYASIIVIEPSPFRLTRLALRLRSAIIIVCAARATRIAAGGKENVHMSQELRRATDEESGKVLIPYKNIPAAQLAQGAMSHIIAGNNMTLSFASLEAGSYFPIHSHPYEQMMLILKGELDAILEGVLYRMRPGDVIVFPHGLQHGAQMRDQDCEILDIFSPARPDYEDKMRKAAGQ